MAQAACEVKSLVQLVVVEFRASVGQATPLAWPSPEVNHGGSMYQTKESCLKGERCGVYHQGPGIPFKGSQRRVCVCVCVLEKTVLGDRSLYDPFIWGSWFCFVF